MHDNTWQVDIQENNGEINISVVDSFNEKSEYAFYIYINDELHHTIWYGPETKQAYRHNEIGGIYHCLAFKRLTDNSTETRLSRKLMIFNNKIDINLLSNEISDGPHLIEVDNTTFPVLFKRQPGPYMFVLLSGAINRKNVTPPVFNRWSWASKFPGSVICIADPTLELDDEIELGWYVGSARQDLTESTARIIVKLCSILRLEKSKIITYGSSGGGFAALMVTNRIGFGVAVAINCQSEILNYNKLAVQKFLEICFPSYSAEMVLDIYRDRVSASSVWGRQDIQTRALLVQNKRDFHHYQVHFNKLADSLGLPINGGESKNGLHFAILYEDDNGHAPEPIELFPLIVSKAITLCK